MICQIYIILYMYIKHNPRVIETYHSYEKCTNMNNYVYWNSITIILGMAPYSTVVYDFTHVFMSLAIIWPKTHSTAVSITRSANNPHIYQQHPFTPQRLLTIKSIMQLQRGHFIFFFRQQTEHNRMSLVLFMWTPCRGRVTTTWLQYSTARFRDTYFFIDCFLPGWCMH